MKKTFMFLWILLCVDSKLSAFSQNGRISFGAFNSKEKLSLKVGDSPTEQEYSATSQRVAYQAQDFGLGRSTEFVTDLRNEYDFFDALNVEMRSFESRNRFQARTLYIKTDSLQKGFYYQVGRYNVRELGSSYNDGLHVGFRVNNEDRVGLFGGLNPRQLDRSHLQSSTKNTNFGIYFDHVSDKSKLNPLEFTLGVSQEKYSNLYTREYLFETFTQRWTNKWLYSLGYIDFGKRTQITNGQIQFTHHLFEAFQYKFAALAFDVINYRLNQDLREKLSPNPYREFQSQFDFFAKSKAKVSLYNRLGERDIDHLKRQRHTLTWQPTALLNNTLEFWLRAEYRKEFTKEGFFTGVSVNVHNDDRDWTLSIDKGSERQTQGFRLNPLLIDGSYNFYFKQSLFGGLSVQWAKDEQAQILSFFLNLIYRFGDRPAAKPQPLTPTRGSY